MDTVTESAFFQDVPPGQVKLVSDLVTKQQSLNNDYLQWEPGAIRLYCASEQCDGYRSFDAAKDNYYVKKGGEFSQFVTYACRNCQKSFKRYAVSIERVVDVGFSFYKFGEVPQFGPPNPSKLMNLMGSERDAYLKGRRCENQGLGIAAFAYYRRVVENQKTKIIGEILKVAQKLNADPELIKDLQAAKEETRFTEAINKVKHALPQVLLINGHNPLTLLHSALSEGLHATSDEECLELATSIRVVLTELVERMATAVKEEAELTSAVQRLLKAGGKKQG
jgi:hypothetical protein